MTKTTFAHGQLKSLIERIERLEEDKKVVSGDIKEVYAEAKANGFDAKIIRLLVRLRKKEASEREEEQSMLDVYMAALGMLPEEQEAYSEAAKGDPEAHAPTGPAAEPEAASEPPVAASEAVVEG